MGARSFHSSRYEHPTETDPRVISYLSEHFGMCPTVNQSGADLSLPDGTKVEVKSTKEWHKSTHSRGARRRGRFCMHGYEECDFVLFVLVLENGNLAFFLLDYLTVLKRFGLVGTINWKEVIQ